MFKTKLAQATKEVQDKKRKKDGKYRNLTIVERCGKWTIGSVVFISILVGASWMFVYLNLSSVFASRTVIINNVIETVQAKELPTTESNTQAIASLIYKNESSEGKNGLKKCLNIGKVNNIGYGVWGDNFMCFDDHASEMETLTKWIDKHFNEGMTENELLCHYSGNNYVGCVR